MAGRVLRDSNGRYAGSTRGWGRGRQSHGGGFGSGKKGKTRSVAANRRMQAAARLGKAAGINAAKMAATTVGGTAIGLGMMRAGVKPSNVVAAGWAGYVGYRATRQIVKRRQASRS